MKPSWSKASKQLHSLRRSSRGVSSGATQLSTSLCQPAANPTAVHKCANSAGQEHRGRPPRAAWSSAAVELHHGVSLKASRPAQMAKSFGVFDAFPEISKSSRVTIATVIKSGLPIAPRASCGLHRAAAPAFARGWQRIVVRRSPLLAAPQTMCSRPGEAASPSRPAAALHRSKNSQNAAHFVASGWWTSVCRFWLHALLSGLMQGAKTQASAAQRQV